MEGGYLVLCLIILLFVVINEYFSPRGVCFARDGNFKDFSLSLSQTSSRFSLYYLPLFSWRVGGVRERLRSLVLIGAELRQCYFLKHSPNP